MVVYLICARPYGQTKQVSPQRPLTLPGTTFDSLLFMKYLFTHLVLLRTSVKSRFTSGSLLHSTFRYQRRFGDVRPYVNNSSLSWRKDILSSVLWFRHNFVAGSLVTVTSPVRPVFSRVARDGAEPSVLETVVLLVLRGWGVLGSLGTSSTFSPDSQ